MPVITPWLTVTVLPYVLVVAAVVAVALTTRDPARRRTALKILRTLVPRRPRSR